MFTVVDQARPWLSPNSTLAKTTQPQEGAKMMRSGTGNAADQPSSRTPRRPRRSASRPATKLLAALTRPKLIKKEKIAARLATWKSWPASGAKVERSTPTIPPTKALTATRMANCLQLARRPSFTPGCAFTREASDDRAAIGSRLQLAGILRNLAALV